MKTSGVMIFINKFLIPVRAKYIPSEAIFSLYFHQKFAGRQPSEPTLALHLVVVRQTFGENSWEKSLNSSKAHIR